MLSELAQHVEVHPAQRERAAPVAVDHVVQSQGRRRAARCLACLAVCSLDGGNGVVVMKNERLVRGRGDADLGTGPAGDRFVEPDLLSEGRVLHQAQQCGPGWHQRSARLLLGQPVKAPVELPAVLVEEHLELGPGWLTDNVLGRHRWEGRHELSISAWPRTSQLPYRHDRRPRRGIVRTSAPMVSGRYGAPGSLAGTTTAISPPRRNPADRPRSSPLQKRPASYQFGRWLLAS